MKKYIIAFLFICSILGAKNISTYNSWVKNIDDSPALLYVNPESEFKFAVPSIDVLIQNNAVDIDFYNSINGDSLSMNQRDELLDKMGSKLKLLASADIDVMSYRYKNFGVKINSELEAKFNIDRQYLEIILKGNDYNKTYHFTKENNNGQALLYSNLSFGAGLGSINKWFGIKNIPEIYFGTSANILFGHFNYEVSDFDGTFTTTDDEGLNVNQKLTIKSAKGGVGFSAGFGFNSMVYKNLMLGLNFKKIGGFINWNKNTEKKEFTAKAEDIFVSDIDGDFFTDSDTTYAVSSYKTKIPAEMSFSTSYNLNEYNVDFIFDYTQRLSKSNFASDKPELALGAKYTPFSWFYVACKTDFANSDRLYSVNYDFGLNFKHYEFVIATKAVDALFPSNASKGFGIKLESRIKF